MRFLQFIKPVSAPQRQWQPNLPTTYIDAIYRAILPTNILLDCVREQGNPEIRKCKLHAAGIFVGICEP